MSRLHADKAVASMQDQTSLVCDRRRGSPVENAALCRSSIDDGQNGDRINCLDWSIVRHEGTRCQK